MPAATDPLRKLVTTMARNGPMVQPNDASAYAAPNAAMAGTERVSAGRDAPAGEAGQVAAGQQPGAQADQDDAEHDGDPGQGTLDGAADRGQQRPEHTEHERRTRR